MPYDPLFAALAQAKSLPSHAYRTAEAALNIPEQAFEGYGQGLRLRQMLKQPQAFEEAYAATPEGQRVINQIGPGAGRDIFFGMQPEQFATMMGGGAQRELGYAGLGTRQNIATGEQAVQAARTKALESIAGERDVSTNIKMHDDAINTINGQIDALIGKLPGGVGGTVWSAAQRALSDYVNPNLSDPHLQAIQSQLQPLVQQRRAHALAQNALLQGQGYLKNSVMQQITQPTNIDTGAGGDTSLGGGSDWLQVHSPQVQ